MNLSAAFGIAVRNERRKLKLSQEELAEAAGLHYNFIGLVERGKTAPALDSIVAIASALGLEVSELIRVAENMTSATSAD